MAIRETPPLEGKFTRIKTIVIARLCFLANPMVIDDRTMDLSGQLGNRTTTATSDKDIMYTRRKNNETEDASRLATQKEIRVKEDYM